MKKLVKIVFFCMFAMLVVSCSEKKKHDDIIAPKAEKPKLQAPVRMQDYNQTTDGAEQELSGGSESYTWRQSPYG